MPSRGRSHLTRPRLVRASAAPAVSGSLAETLPPLGESGSGAFTTPSGSNPNEPAGYTRIAENAHTNISNGATAIAGDWVYYPRTPAKLSTVTAGADGSAIQILFEDGRVQGTGGGLYEGWNGTTEYSAVYESTIMRIPTTDFETQAVGVKFLGYWGCGRKTASPDPTQILGISDGTGTAEPLTEWAIKIQQQDVLSRSMTQNIDATKMFVAGGKWMQVEILMTLNDIGSANGTLKLWIDGVLLSHYTDVTWRTATDSHGFWGKRMDPIWGGAGGANKTRDDYVQIDHTYISGIPL